MLTKAFMKMAGAATVGYGSAHALRIASRDSQAPGNAMAEYFGHPGSPLAGHVNPTSIFKSIGVSYNTIGDVPGLSTFTGLSAVGGGLGGATLGLSMGRLAGKGIGFGAAGAAVGLAAGAIYGVRKGLETGASFYGNLNNIIKEKTGLGGPPANRRSMRVGSGVSTWTSPATGRKMSPNHLGADGSLVLAQHRIRHRSLI